MNYTWFEMTAISLSYFFGSIYPNWIEQKLEMFKIMEGILEREREAKCQNEDVKMFKKEIEEVKQVHGD